MRAGVKGIGVYPFADGDSGNHFAGGVVHHGHELVIAAEEQVMIFHINGHAGGAFAGGNGPAVGDGVGLGVNGHEFAGVFDIVENAIGVGIGLGEFGFAAFGDGGDDLAGIGGDDGGGLAAAVEGIDLILAGLEENAVGILAGGDGGGGLQGGEIHDAHLIGFAIADEKAVQFGGDGNAMNTEGVGDFTGDGVRGKVNDQHLRAVGDIEAVGVGIHGEIIPAAIAGEGDFLQKMVGFIRTGGSGRQREQGQDRENRFHIGQGIKCLRLAGESNHEYDRKLIWFTGVAFSHGVTMWTTRSDGLYMPFNWKLGVRG